MPFELSATSIFGTFARYHSGWSMRRDKDFLDRRSTIRDIGRGSAKQTDYLGGRSAEEEGPAVTFESIRDQCVGAGALWEDPEFPAVDESLYFDKRPVEHEIVWKRPGELCSDPQLFVGGASRLDVNQGVLGDCWFLAAVAALAGHPRLLYRVVPRDQSFSENYGGIFHFQFWQYGRWVDVCIDDRLPTCYDQLIYMHSKNHNEFWTALVEKAYAKLNGCYESLSGGLTSEALTDFCGGLVEKIELRDKTPEDLFKTMLRDSEKGSLMGCSIDATPDQLEARLNNGLVIGHAYTITNVRYIQVETSRVSGKIPMIRCRNPWGNEAEWNGAWSDNSEEWQLVPEEERASIGLTLDKDGEFWMSFEDWSREYERLEICHLGPDTLVADDSGDVAEEIRRWEGSLHEGGWKKRVNAGGCRNYLDTFWTNPQYRINISEADADDIDGKGSIIVAVMQKDRRKLRKEGKDNLTIGYAVYSLDDPNCGTLGYRFFGTHKMSARSKSFINTREVCDHHALEPGHYVIVPSTFQPNEEGDFILRILSERADNNVKELDDATGDTGPATDDLPDDTPEDDEAREAGYQAFVGLAGADGEIDAYELRDILNNTFQKEFAFDGFSSDICRSMVAMRDADLSGKLGYADFKGLWADLVLCRKAFKLLDTDNSGHFNSYEFRRVLNTIGLKVSNSTFNALVMRYSDRDGFVHFDDFVACVVKLKTMFESYKEKDPQASGEATFTMDEFVQMSMYS